VGQEGGLMSKVLTQHELNFWYKIRAKLQDGENEVDNIPDAIEYAISHFEIAEKEFVKLAKAKKITAEEKSHLEKHTINYLLNRLFTNLSFKNKIIAKVLTGIILGWLDKKREV
jgi:hypothetical protein